jgi:hypothetical protein
MLLFVTYNVSLFYLMELHGHLYLKYSQYLIETIFTSVMTQKTIPIGVICFWSYDNFKENNVCEIFTSVLFRNSEISTS